MPKKNRVLRAHARGPMIRRRVVWKAAALLVAAGYAGVVGLSRLAYRTALYPAVRRGLDEAPEGATMVWLETTDGTPVQAVLYPADGPSTVVYFHGNGETIADSVALAQAFARRDIGFIAVEYRGYGSSRAQGPSEQGLYEDAEAVLIALRQGGQRPESLVLWGSSLGTGVAVEMALRGLGGRLLLSAPYTSIPDVAGRLVPFLPVGRIIEDRFDNLSKASRLGVPTLILHGDRDRIVPYDMGVTLSKAIANARLITVAGAGHNDLFAQGFEELFDQIEAFVKEERFTSPHRT